MAGELSSALEHFILQNLRSFEHLEALVTIHREPTRWWTGEVLGETLGTTASVADQILEDLCSANLLEVRVSSAVVYQFSPGSPEIEARVRELLDALRHPRMEIYTLITSPSTRALRDFADAFRFRRKDRG